MSFSSRAAAVAAALALFVPGAGLADAQSGPPPLAVHVDASRAVQGLISVHETIPVSSGPLTLIYPKWIPGEHSPSGAIANVAGIHVSAAGQTIAWTRDPVDLFSFHVDVPAGVSSLDVDFVYLGANGGNYSTARLSTPNLLSLTWNKVILTPKVEDYHTQQIAASLTLPGANWQYATALDTVSHQGAEVTFKPVSQAHLVDSPLDAGTNARTWNLGTFNGAPVTLAAFADTPEELAAPDATIDKFRNLVTQMHALYRYRHFDHYTFLLTLSDVMPGEGVEHHQSSDDGTDGKFLTEHAALVGDADLLAHEWNHSWDGKYRRPYDLATKNLQDPMGDTLLWVYEGMTQFYGNLQAERSGLRTKEEWLDSLADTYAVYDTQRGRDWRPLADTATAASVLYSSPRQWSDYRRGVDYYSEGELMWLQADELIKKLSGNKRSIDDVARAFFGDGKDTGAALKTYTRADVIAAFNAVQPYDWTTFFHQHIDVITPHPPDFLTGSGYKLVYTATPSAFDKLMAGQRHGISTRYSLGFTAVPNGTVVDVVPGSPAFNANIGPGDKIVAVDDRALTGGQEQIDDALKTAQNGSPIRLLLETGNVFRQTTISYAGGPRYPHLQRVDGTPDVLSEIAKALPAN
jgi:predicted metalloprotease with PDZ domain